MECPFELPVRSYKAINMMYCVCFEKNVPYFNCLTKEQAEFLVQAINSHEKLKTVSHNLAETMGIDYAIKTLSVSEDTMAVGAAAILKGIQAQAKQALKESGNSKEKPKETEVERLGKRVARTGNHKDLQKYLKARRNAR